MNRKEFVYKWNNGAINSGLRVVQFNGGSIFADTMTIQTVKKITKRTTTEYDEVVFRKNIGGVLTETGTCRIDKIKEIL